MITQQVEAVTVSGKARLTYRIEWGGTMEVTAVSEPATISSQLLLNIERGIAEIIMPTPTPQPTPTSTPVPTATPTLAPTVVVTEAPVSSGFPSLGDWFTAFLMVLASAGVTYLLGYFWWGSTRWGLRSALCTALGGLAAYLVLNLGFEGTQTWLAQEGRGFVLQVVMIGLFLGWIAALAWWMVADRNKYTQLKE